MTSVYTDSVLDSTQWESWVVCVISSVSSVASFCSIVTFLKFSFLFTYPRNMFFFFTCVDFLAGIMVVTGFAVKADPCVEIHIAYAVFMYIFFVEFMWLSAISHAIFCELKEKKLSIWIMKNTSEAVERNMIVPKSEKNKIKERRYKMYHLICWGVPTVYYIFVLILSDPCEGVHPIIWLIPEILTLFFSIYFAVHNTILARECIRLLGLGTNEASIDGSNFSRYGVYFGMLCVFGVTRFPAVCSALLRTILDDRLHSTTAQQPFQAKALLGIDAVLSPIQGIFLFMWFSTKFKYFQLWWTEKWFRDVVRCRCCRRSRYDVIQLQNMVLSNDLEDIQEEEDRISPSSKYELMDNNEEADNTEVLSPKRDPSNRKSVATMPVIETFTGMF